MTKLHSFKKYEISDLNKIKGGGISRKSGETETTVTTDIWYLFKKNNLTNSGSHSDQIETWKYDEIPSS